MKHFKLFFALFAMLALGVGNAWGANYAIVAKKGSGDGSSLSTSTKVTDVFSNDTYVAKFTTATKSYYNGSNGLKLGASSDAGDLKFTLTEGGKVKATTIIVSAKRYNTSKSVTLQVIAGGVTCTAQTISTSSNFTDYTYTINANITDIQLKTSKYCWVESITINYEDSGSGETAASLVKIEKTAGKTEFVEGDSFEKATITATYDDETTKDVTSLATFSAPNMTQIGKQTVSVSYKEGEVTAETSYTINITEKPKYTVTWKVNGEDYTTTQVAEGNKPTFPTTPESCDATSTTFYGWATEAWSGKINDISDKTIYTSASAMPAETATYHAVFCEGSGSTTLINETFDDSSTTDSNQEIGTTFSNFAGASSKAFKSQYGGVKFGNSSTAGYITSKSLDLSSPFTVTLDACKFGSDAGNIEVTVGAETKTINNSSLGAAGTFNTYTLEFDAATATSTVKIATSQKRAYIDNVVIATKGAATNFVTTCAAAPEPAVLVSIAANAEGKNEFTEGDEFVKAIITATYDDATTKDVTEEATFTGYDMSIPGEQTVTVEYEDKTTTYTITVTAKPAATLTLSKNGGTELLPGNHKQGDFVTLPDFTSDCSKTFVGWSENQDCNTEPEYKAGDYYELKSEGNQTIYAVYADENNAAKEEVYTFSTFTSADDVTITEPESFDIKLLKNSGSTKPAFNSSKEEARLYAKGSLVISADAPISKIVYTYIVNKNNNNVVPTIDGVTGETNAGTWDASTKTWTGNDTKVTFSTSGTAGNVGFTKVAVTVGAITYSNYSTTCASSVEYVELGDDFKWSATEAEVTIDATDNVFPTLTNTHNVPVTYSSSDDAIASIASDGTVTLKKEGTVTITAKYAGGTSAGTGKEYKAKTVDYTLTVKQLVSCADIYNLADDATFVLKDFVVTYVNGKYTYIKDDAGYGLIFTNSGAYGLKAGDQVASGKFEGKKTTYRTLVEIIPITACGDLNATPGTAPEPEVMTNTPTNADINKYVKFENVSFKYTNLNDTYKTNSGKLEGQTEYNIAFYNKFTSNVTFDTSKKYDVVGVVSIKDDAIEVYFISAEEVAEPTLNVKITDTDFGKIAINGKAERTLTLNGSLLTKPVSLAIEGDYFTLESNSVTPVDGKIEEEKIKITFKPTAEGTHTATLKITSDELAEQTITLQGQAVQQHTVHFFVNGEEDETLAKKVLSGEKLTEIPTATSCDPLEYPTFIGWSASEITGTTDVEPTDLLDLNTTITADCNYYAVFAKETTTSSSSESATMAYSGTTTNMTDGNNASTVGLDEALFTITSDKGGQGNHVGLNKAGDIRLYANKTDGNGNILTIAMAEGYTITQISLDIEESATFVVKANGQSITGTEDVYDINHSSCSIQNTTTGETTQLRLNSITISYTTSTISKEYLTTCESATPTYTVTYNLDGGESTCETSVVVEQNGELTLCDAPTKKGHTFLKWKDQSDNEYEAGATITVSSNLTLTAQWQKESYKVTWTSLGEKVASANVEYNSQPTKPATDPSYTCGIGSKEFVGWTTQEIDGVGVPANLYTDEFPVVTEAITYYAVFAGRSAEASTTISTLLVTEKLGNYASGSMKDDQENVWKYYAGGLQDGETYYIALRNNNDEISYIESPKFSGTVQSIVAHVKNGSSKVRTVYLRSSAIEKPAEGDLGATSIPASNNSEVNLDFTSSFDKFYIQVSDGLQFHKIVVTSGIAIGDYVDYVTSCKAFEVSIEVVDQLVFDPINMNTKEEKNLAITTLNYNGALTFSITGTDASHFTYGTFTDGQLPITYQPTEAGEHTATLTITAGEKTATVTLIGKSIDYVSGIWELVTDAATLTIGDKVVVVAKEKNFALSTTQKENNRGQAAVTKNNDNTISFKGDVQILTLKKGFVNNTFALYTGDGYLYAASNSSNHLKTLATIVPKSSWSITIQNDITTIAAQENSHNIMQYNFSSKLFACYENSNLQDPICLYRKKNIKVDETSDNTSIPNQSDVTVDNAELTVTTEAEYDNMYIGGNGTVKVETEVTINNLYISTTMGAIGATTSGQLSTTQENLNVTGDVFIDITLGKNDEGKNGDPNQWHAFTVPFPVDAMNGVYDIDDNKLTNEVNYAIMDYHGDLRANGQYGWKKYRGILVPGTFYLMTVDGERDTYRFKKVEDAAIVAPATKAITAYTGTGDATKDKGWNGVGNPTLMHGKVGYKALILNPKSYTYEPIPENTAYFTVGTPFFIQTDADGTMTMTAETSASLAPARRAAAAVENIKVMLGNSDYTDRLYVSASEDAINEYEIGKDLGKMAMTSTPSVVQISALAYDTRLCMIDAPMANNEALVALNLYAPANGEYTLSVQAQDNEKVYLLHEGTFVWDLSMSEYPITLNKGDNAGYSILVRRADAPTSVETIDGANNQTEKLIHNGNLYILHNGKVFDAVGTMLK